MGDRRVIDNATLLGDVCRLLSEGRGVRLRAKGASMRPFIHDGDVLALVPVTDFRKGDVVLARVDGGGYVVHRVIGLTGTRVILMGDGNLFGKEYCGRGDVFGRVTGVIRDGRERSLITPQARMRACGRRLLLPARRLRQRIKNLMKRLID